MGEQARCEAAGRAESVALGGARLREHLAWQEVPGTGAQGTRSSKFMRKSKEWIFT